MDKKSIVLLIVSSIILILAIIFAVWSFQIDLGVSKENNLANENIIINQNQNNINSENNNNPSNTSNTNNQNGGNNTLEDTETNDFSAIYTDFTVEDEDGNQIRLSDYRDNPVVVIFLNNENEDSTEMLNRIDKQYENYKENVNFIVVEAGENENLALQNIKFPIYYDKQEEVVKLYNVTEFPTILYINKNNEIFNAKTGLPSVDALTANLDILIENF